MPHRLSSEVALLWLVDFTSVKVAADDWQLPFGCAGHVIFHSLILLLWHRSTQNSMSHRTLTQYREQRDIFVAETIFKSQYAPSLEELRFLQQRNLEQLLTQRYWAFAEAVQRLSSVWQDVTPYCWNSIARCMILAAREALVRIPNRLLMAVMLSMALFSRAYVSETPKARVMRYYCVQ